MSKKASFQRSRQKTGLPEGMEASIVTEYQRRREMKKLQCTCFHDLARGCIRKLRHAYV
ncbi:hypothetical protein KP509_08G036000 [Ceratopteris richardii]|uniref:Uncharacterized protein n=1 Tax=Ceratopteris richardii TaxID=49495 RepID=A0A8T2U765_CERRI|nr:hypothetical protein KP509_08G036000 [Ceratopteris richardii]